VSAPADSAAPSRLGSIAAGLVAAVVVLLVVGVIATVAVAAVSQTPKDGGVVVFTVSAPYRPATGNPATNPAVVPVAANAPAPQGNWTAARGRKIAERALAWLRWPYSFGAGDASGPTFGFAVDEDSRNDAHVRGFDCSGLVINAVAPWLSVDHSAAAQYTEAGSFHPSLATLQPGDLVFWSKDGTILGIGHVAVYLGNGYVVEAPHSGAYVQVTPLNQVEPGRIGTTRPLT
jgi:cell wall-associated NlpC family hydrolase